MRVTHCRPALWGVASLVLSYAGVASAQLTQPGGAPIPSINSGVTTCSDKNLQVCIDAAEGVAGTVDAINDAQVTPERFNPFCNLTFLVAARGSAYDDVFGWYNVIVDPNDSSKTLKPALTDLHSFLTNSDPVGTSRTLDVRNDPAYLGGEIAFFIAAGRRVTGTSGNPPASYANIFYSERMFNEDAKNSTDSWIHLLIYQSVQHENSFYFAWEDLLSGGDNDFDDLLTLVSGIQCTGSGAACDTGQLGICAEGVMQCQNGGLTCIPLQPAGAEQCNALDDDCNGEIDDGDLCAAGEVCDRGQCVKACGEVINTCKPQQTCDTAGYCVDQGCVDVDCPSGQICSQGECKAACDGVSCPLTQVCLSGRCQDPCLTIQCDGTDVCDLGVCKPSCACTGCSGAEVCDNPIGRCVDSSCLGMSCGAGTTCVNGTCVDNCVTAVCPSGQKCTAGQCIDACSDVSCESGLKCLAGVCVDACVGVVCGPGLKCVPGDKNLGECVDGCLGVDCGATKQCKFGSCGTDCVGVTCPDGETCNAGSCSNLCSTLMCPDGEVCRGGACEDACADVTCPPGQLCDTGLCVGDPDYLNQPPGSGGAGSVDEDGGAESQSGGAKRVIDQDSGCACRVGAAEGDARRFAGLAALLAAGGMLLRRRRR